VKKKHAVFITILEVKIIENFLNLCQIEFSIHNIYIRRAFS